MLGNFADMQQAVGAGEELHESAKFCEADDFAQVGLAEFRARGNLAHHGESRIARGSAGRENMHGAVFEHVNFDPGLFRNGFDFLSARTNEVADFVRRNIEFVEARRIGGNL